MPSIKPYLKYCEIKIHKKEFQQSKNSTDFNLINTNKIAVSVEFELYESDKSYNRYKDVVFVRPLCIILPQMSESIICFDGKSKIMSFPRDYEENMIKYNKKLERNKENAWF